MNTHDDRETVKSIRDKILADSQGRQEVKIIKLKQSSLGYHYEKILYYSRHGILWGYGGYGQKGRREPTPHPPSLALFRNLVTEGCNACKSQSGSKYMRLITQGDLSGWLQTSWPQLAIVAKLTTDKLKSALRFLEDGEIIKRHSPAGINDDGDYRRQFFMWIDVDRVMDLAVEVVNYSRNNRKDKKADVRPRAKAGTKRLPGDGMNSPGSRKLFKAKTPALAESLATREPVSGGVERTSQTGEEKPWLHGVRAPYLVLIYTPFGTYPFFRETSAHNETTCSLSYDYRGLPGERKNLAAVAAVFFENEGKEKGLINQFPVVFLLDDRLKAEIPASMDDGQNQSNTVLPGFSVMPSIELDPFSNLGTCSPGKAMTDDDFLNFPDPGTVAMAVQLKELFSDCPEQFDDELVYRIKQAVYCQQPGRRLTEEVLEHYKRQRAIHHSGDVPFVFRIERASEFIKNWRQIAQTVHFLKNRDATDQALDQLVAAHDFSRRRSEDMAFMTEIGFENLHEYPAISVEEGRYFKLLSIAAAGQLDEFLATVPVDAAETIKSAARFVVNSYLDLRFLEEKQQNLVPLLFPRQSHRERLQREYEGDLRRCEITVGTSEMPNSLGLTT